MVHFIITGFPLQDPSLVVQQFMSRNWALTGDGWDAEWPLNFQRLTVWSIAPITRSQGDRVYEEIAPPGRRGGRHFLAVCQNALVIATKTELRAAPLFGGAGGGFKVTIRVQSLEVAPAQDPCKLDPSIPRMFQPAPTIRVLLPLQCARYRLHRPG